jgi:hypothetical protein
VELCCIKHVTAREQLEQLGKQLGVFGVEVGQSHTEEDQVCEPEQVMYFSMMERHVQRYAFGVNQVRERQEELQLRPGTPAGEKALVDTLFSINVSCFEVLLMGRSVNGGFLVKLCMCSLLSSCSLI